jgi:TPR repeat protein
MSFAKSSALSARLTVPARVAAASLVLLSALPAQNPATATRTAGRGTGSALDAVPAAEPPQLVKPTDEELSLSFLRQPGEKARAAFDAYKGGKFDEARKQSEALVAAGDANGMFLLALCHQFGRGGQPSLPDAEKWLRAAAEKGHDAARTNLGLLLYSTHSNDKDRLAEAVRVLREASTNDGARAGMVLGELYARGVGATADFGEAVR